MTKLLVMVASVLSACGALPSVSPGDPQVPARPIPDGRWAGPQHEEVPDAVISLKRGSAHCDWESVWFRMSVGHWAIQRTIQLTCASMCATPSAGSRPEPLEPLTEAAEVPNAATYSGYSSGGVELWLGGVGDDAAYLVWEGVVERWLRAEPIIVCD